MNTKHTGERLRLRAFLKAFELLSLSEIDDFIDNLSYKKIAKDEYFIKEGQLADSIAFVLSGQLRSYYFNSNEEEVTYCFTFENSFLSAYSSFLTGIATTENIQALSDVEMFIASKKQIKALEASSNNWLKLLKMVAEQEYIKMEQRIFMLQKESAEKRYADLQLNHPDFLQTISLQYLASYLGITQRHLSRIRKNISF